MPTQTTISGPDLVTVDAGGVCVLTANVTANGAPVTEGFVRFDEGWVPLGTATLQADGTATLRTVLPPGNYFITANFGGSNQGAPSRSNLTYIQQEGMSSTTLAANGTGPYTLTATVTGNQNFAPAGTVTFMDETTNTVLGTAPLIGQGVSSSLGSQASGFAGDFNGDGRTDYASMSFTANNTAQITVRLANADGTYTSVTSTPLVNQKNPFFGGVADFNGDGLTDIVIVDSGSVYVLLSDDSGHFIAGTGPTGLDTNTQFEVAGDFNGDGKMDVLVNMGPGQTMYANLGFLAGDGKGNLAAPRSSTANIYPAYETADFNLDGNLDLVGTPIDPASLNQGPQTIYLGGGDGVSYTQLPQSIFGGYVQPTPVPVYVPIIADFNRDGFPDLVFFNGGSTVTVLPGDGKGNFNAQPPIVTNIGSHYEGYAEPLDINGDGIMDLAVFVEDQPQQHDQPPPPYNMLELIGDGEGHFAVSPEVPESSGGFGSYATAPVPFTYPALGTTALAPSRTVGTSIAALTGITLNGAGMHTIVAMYNGDSTIVASNSAPVSLAGASTEGRGKVPVAFGKGFTAGGVQLNGSAQVVGTALELTDGGANEAGSAFFPVPLDEHGFDTEFTFQLDNAQADGFTFTLQGVNPQALGGTGGSLGFAGIPDSVGISFDLFNNSGEGANSVGLYANGEQPDVAGRNFDLTALSGGQIDLHSGHVFKAHVVCCWEKNMTMTLTDTNTGASTSVTWFQPFTLQTQLGYAGFTGATGALTSTQKILTWKYSPLPNYFFIEREVEPSMNQQDMTLNGGASINLYTRRLHMISSGIANQATSAFFQSPVDVRHFTTQFWFQGSNDIGDGFTFVLQNAGLNALGPYGGGLGYGSDNPYESTASGIQKSVAIKFDFYSNAGEGTNSTGLYLDGASPTVPAFDLSNTGIVLTNGDLFWAQLNYDGTTLTEEIWDVNKGIAATQTYKVNIPAAVGGNKAYAGFTAGAGSLSGNEDILDWVYVPIDETQ